MKSKNILSIILLLVSLLLVACSSNNISTDSDSSLRQIRIGATTVPHSEILEFIKPTLKDQGIDLQITTFSEYTQINQSTSAGDLDANFFQHIPYLDSYVRESGQKLVAVGPVHIEPMGIYSNAIKSMDELPDGATVAYPNDATNGNRAFLLLINNGYIKLKDGATIQVTEDDIA